MLWLSDTNFGTIVMDAAALFLLAGIAANTRVYRDRGRMDDKIYSALLLVTMLAAFFDGLNYFLETSPFAFKGGLIIFGDTIFSLAYEAFPVLFILYLDYHINRKSNQVNKMWKIVAIPAVAAAVLIIGNIFGGYLFYIDQNGAYQFGKLYDIINYVMILYIFVVLYMLWKTDKRFFIAFLILVAVRIVLRNVIRGVSSTSFVLAVFLVYAHIYSMNEEFYEEEEA